MPDTGDRLNKRRRLLVALGASALAAPFGSLAQQPAAAMRRVGILGPSSLKAAGARWPAFFAGLRDLGYVEGRSLVIESRWAEGKYERLPELAAELVRLKVEVIVTHTSSGSLAAKQATTSIPIVIAATGDMQAAGLVDNLARPGGNVTGLSLFSPEVSAKRLELVMEALPKTRRIGVLANGNNVSMKASLEQALERTARTLKVAVQRFEVKEAREIEPAIAAMGKQGMGAVVIEDDPLLVASAPAILIQSVRHRIPAVAAVEFAEAGGLVGFGADFPALFNRAATYVDKILKGTRVGDLPVERASKFELVINQGAANAHGIKLPQALLLRADRVIG
jgi:putative ABC transport system substrate-binding protein